MSVLMYDVVGPAPFPVDMLRHDMCWPASEGDSVVVVTAAVRDSLSDGKLYRVSLRGCTEPAVLRWASFGWKIVRTTQGY